MPHDILTITLLILGFGFVIFFHELGHFLAAKWVGIKVEQFAVGFGQALLAWRKGIGIRVGTTTPEYRKRALARLGKNESTDSGDEVSDRELDRAASELGLGETEYRLNWIPLGGYVKMLGQDDLAPNSQADDPRAYNKKSIPARMLVVSAGVMMNILLAGIGFMIVFRMGLHVPPPRVGEILPGSPAQLAGIQVGDTIYTLDGKRMYDFSKIGLASALAEPNVTIPVEIIRDNKHITLSITPQRMGGDPKGFVALGIGPCHDLGGLSGDDAMAEVPRELWPKMLTSDCYAVEPRDTITAINGQPVTPQDYGKFQQLLQTSYENPIVLSITAGTPPAEETEPKTRTVSIYSHFIPSFTERPVNFLGLVPRARVESVQQKSVALNRLLPGDVITSATYANGDPIKSPPTSVELTTFLRDAGDKSLVISLNVVRNLKGVDTAVAIEKLQTGLKIDVGVHGLGIALGLDETHAVVADTLSDSPAGSAGIPRGATVTSVAGEPVNSWYQVDRVLNQKPQNSDVAIGYTTSSGEKRTATLHIDQAAYTALHQNQYTSNLSLADPRLEPRKADSLLQAAGWGMTETRDLVLQFYLMIRRMAQGDVSPTNISGPIGIFAAGRTFASRGPDWLIWFLSLISANLAVVNFLPIPIVDGGLFTFLVAEKLQGKPLSPKTQAVAQYVGLAFLLGVFLFVTYNDIVRHL